MCAFDDFNRCSQDLSSFRHGGGRGESAEFIFRLFVNLALQ